MRFRLLLLIALGSSPALAQMVESPANALAEDAGPYARRHNVSLDEAVRRLAAEQDSIPASDAIAHEFRDRLAGIAVEHEPTFRLVVTLSGPEPVADRTIMVGATTLPVTFRAGAPFTRAALILALRRHQSELRAAFPDAHGMGFDQRAATLVLLLNPADLDRPASAARAAAILGVPVSLRAAFGTDSNLTVAGGERLIGTDPADGKRYLCTAGFVVGDGTRTAIATAAHCPDALSVIEPAGGEVALPFVGSWGAQVQDVQVNLSPTPLRPLFYANRPLAALRPVTSWRPRASIRAGDSLCHWGERSGYSCAEVELTDFSPPGLLCGGVCEPVWVTVRTPDCHGGDSGGPVFSGTVAVGLVKGGNRTRAGRCNFYYFMSVDYLPPPWRLLHE